MTERLLSIAIDELMADPSQPRKRFDAEAIQRLAASIAARGVLQPLRIVRDAERGCWLIVTGESRWRAGQLAGLTHLPCLVVEGEPDECDLLADRIVENACRSDLAPLDEARALSKLKSLRGCTSQQLAAELGISGASITRSEALLTLPEEIQDLVDDGRIPESAAYEISRLPDAQAQLELGRLVAAGKFSRDQVADKVREVVGKRNVRPRSSRLACRMGGVSLTVAAAEPLTWETLLSALDASRKAAKRLYENGHDVTAFNQAGKG